MDIAAVTPPVPSDFGDKLWEMSPIVYFLVTAVIVLLGALVWTTIQLRKAEAARAKTSQDRVVAAESLEKFIQKVEATRRADAKDIEHDARENIKILAGVSNVLDRLAHEQDRNTTEIRNEIRREAEDTKKHITSAISSLRSHHGIPKE